jgi:2',3'-cyclic-nucleotide 2'-phosphodiesterase/3'-nucleotidase
MRIYHTSDLHDHRGIAPRLRSMRADEPGLLFDCGDSLRGSQTMYFRSEPIIAEMDAAGYDAQGVGNREFHYLFPLLAARARRMHHPLLCANLVDLRGRPLPF